MHFTITGVTLYSNSTVPVMYNDFSSNSRSLHADGSTPTMQHNTMNNNSNDGMCLFNNADGTLNNDQIVGNAGWEELNEIYGNYYVDDNTAAIRSTAQRVIAYIEAPH